MIKIELGGTGDELRKEMLKLLGFQEIRTQAELPVQEEKPQAAAVQTEPAKALNLLPAPYESG